MPNKLNFSFSYSRDVKSLAGFVKGGKDKVPKEANEYIYKLLCGWSETEIKEHIEAVATKSKNILKISARNFNPPAYELGTGSFFCQFFNYTFSMAQSKEDPSECIFTGLLEIEDLETFNEVESLIDSCFDFPFERVFYKLPEGDFDLRELIYSLDDNRDRLNIIFEFSYENDFSKFQLVHQKEGTAINVDKKQIEVNFKKTEPIAKMIQSLKEVDRNIFLNSPKEGGQF